MIRLTELKLPLEHAADVLPALIAQTLGLAPEAITRFTIYKRSFDARKADLLQVYTGFIYRGPVWLRELHEGLAQRVRDGGFASISEAVGCAAR